MSTHTDNGDTQLETPEVGAEFVVYLKSAGSYEAAKKSERDYLVCDENGFAQTKDLPYGVYTVHQVSGWDGRELPANFDVYIARDGQPYRDYDGGEPTDEQKRFARWVNQKALFKSCTWEDFQTQMRGGP